MPMADPKDPSMEEGQAPASESEADELASGVEGKGANEAGSTSSESDGNPAGSDPAEAEVSAEDVAAQLEQLQSEAQEYLDGWQRARAEFANYKKRVDREMLEARQRAAAEILGRYLGVADDLERALKDRPQTGDRAAWADGIELIYRKVQGILESEGVERIQAEGAMFDPAFHEALSHEESDEYEDGRIIDVIQPGYRLGDRVLRPALVRVAKRQD